MRLWIWRRILPRELVDTAGHLADVDQAIAHLERCVEQALVYCVARGDDNVRPEDVLAEEWAK